jgi:hypothetical protein
LKKVILSLENAFLVEGFILVFVVQDPTDPVMGIINESKFTKKVILKIDGSDYISPAHAINGNLAKGLHYAFKDLGASLTIILEDDIVVSLDALCYFRQVYNEHKMNKNFRGINGFSEEIDSSDLRNGIVRLNYGLGWGWAIPARTYESLTKYWTGLDNDHWDFIF